MNYEVPQFIREETKLIGLVNFTQLFILLGIGGFLVVLFFTLEFWLWLILAFIFGPLGFVFAFGQVGGIPFYSVAPFFIRHIWLPKYYFWKKEKIPASGFESSEEKKPQIIKKAEKKELNKETLNQLTQILDK